MIPILNRARGTQKCFSMAIELFIFPNRSEESSLPGLSYLCGLFVLIHHLLDRSPAFSHGRRRRGPTDFVDPTRYFVVDWIDRLLYFNNAAN